MHTLNNRAWFFTSSLIGTLWLSTVMGFVVPAVAVCGVWCYHASGWFRAAIHRWIRWHRTTYDIFFTCTGLITQNGNMACWRLCTNRLNTKWIRDWTVMICFNITKYCILGQLDWKKETYVKPRVDFAPIFCIWFTRGMCLLCIIWIHI